MTVIFLVDTVWKGPVLDQITVTTPMLSVSCGYEFQLGRSYLVYASGPEDALVVSLCSRTMPLTLAQDDLDFLENGQDPVASQDPQPTASRDETVSCNEDDGFNYIALITLISGIIIGIGIGTAVAKRRLASKR